MSDNNQAQDPYFEGIPDDMEVCAIRFFYDGLTNMPKMKIERSKQKEIEYLSLYAMAASQVISENHNRVTEIMGDYIGEGFTEDTVH